MEYNTIFSKSFSRYEQKKFGFGAFLGGLIIFFTFLTVFRPSFHHLPILNMRVSMRARLAMLMFEDTNQRLSSANLTGLQMHGGTIILQPDDSSSAEVEIKPKITPVAEGEIQRKTEPPLQSSFKQDTEPHGEGEEQITVSGVQQEPKPVVESKIMPERKPVCNVMEPRADFCNIHGDVRVQGSSSTVFFAASRMDSFAGNESWRIRPYARKGDSTAMGFVTELSVKPIVDNQVAPRCTINHSIPAVVFSSGGYAGNHFHDFADIIVPLFITSRQFDGEVQFLATNAHHWWLSKYKTILSSLSRYEIIDMDKENEVHCFPSVIIGLYQNFTELRVRPSETPKGYSMSDFRQFLRSSYSLKKKKAIRLKNRMPRKPRLLIISRKRTRSFTNEGDIVEMAKSLGFAVIVAEPGMEGLSKFAELVNSCDVMMGVHGAGLTNLVFLPTNAILIQIVPWGNLEWLCSHYFGEPAVDMKLRYLDYKIKEEESTLIEQYPHDHPVLRDPMSIHKQGWNSLKTTYLDKQNVNLDVNRFKGTLLKALKLLHS